MTTEKEGDEKKARGTDWGQFALFALGELITLAILIGMILYLLAQYSKNSFQSFEMATVVGLVGGFIFVAAFAEHDDKKLGLKLRRVGVLYLLATIALVVFGFYQAADQAQLIKGGFASGWVAGFYVFTFYAGALLFCAGIVETLTVIPKLVGIDSLSDLFKRKTGRNQKG